jgi:hypothetical protein
MTLLNVAVFMGTARLNLTALETIVTGQTPIVVGKNLWVANLVDGATEVVCPMVFGNPTELPQGILKPGTETLIALGKTYAARLPVRPAQDKMI